MQEKEKSSTDELPTRFAVKIFLSYESLKSRKRRIFFPDKLNTRARAWKPLSPPGLVCCQKKGGCEKEKKKTKEGGLSPQEGDVRKKKRKRPRKARRWLHEGKVPCVLNQEFLFLVHKYLGLEAARLVSSIGSYKT